MSLDLQSHRARLHGIEEIVPLLEAIGSVAEIAYRRASSVVDPVAKYADEVNANLQMILASLPPQDLPAFAFAGDQSGLTLLLAVSSERGLCGAFNSMVATRVGTLYQELRSQGLDVKIACWGGRAKRLIESSGMPIWDYREFPSMAVPTYEMVENLALYLLDLREKEGIRTLLAIYNQPGARLRYQVRVHKLLPMEPEPKSKDSQSYEIKPSGDELALLVHALAERLITALYQIAIESALSEQAARIVSMRLAVDNARNLAEQLRFEYNLAVQHQTTNGLLEVISGYRTMTEEPGR
jgi:F-type H+-transporting ATPase subunit gamma